MSSRTTVETAFALGGLAGHNYHGLGFLQAALDTAKTPQMVSCTSGQIYWVWNYLLARECRLPHVQGVESLEQLAHACLESGKRPSVALGEVIDDAPALLGSFIEKLGDVDSFFGDNMGYWLNLLLNNIPSRIFLPALDKSDCEEISDRFNREREIGILFNSYDPIDGVEYVHMNETAANLRQRSFSQQSSYRVTDRHQTGYRPITGESVRNALWIYEYGFENQTFLDGAYFRQVMLCELSRAETIYVARPVRERWIGDLPCTFGDKEDLKTETFMNAAYYGERFSIELMNRLLRNKMLRKRKVKKRGYHEIAIREIPFRIQKGFVGYFREDIEVFDQARHEAKVLFAAGPH